MTILHLLEVAQVLAAARAAGVQGVDVMLMSKMVSSLIVAAVIAIGTKFLPWSASSFYFPFAKESS
jgi:hypothetical protein